MSWKSTHTTSITNKPAWMIGGSASRLGKPPSAVRAIQIRANGQGPNARTIFRVNQLAGGVGRGTGEFRPNADGVNLTRSLTHRGHNIVGYLLKKNGLPSSVAVIKTQTNGYHLKILGSDWVDVEAFWLFTGCFQLGNWGAGAGAWDGQSIALGEKVTGGSKFTCIPYGNVQLWNMFGNDTFFVATSLPWP